VKRDVRPDGVVWRRWDEIDRLFAAALDHPVEQRQRFVAGECGGDLELMRTVLELLAATEEQSIDRPSDAFVRAARARIRGA
jgi:hypothetical protein